MLGLGGRNKGNYPYATARVRAKKAFLLTKDNYPKLLMMDLNEIGRFMGETQYKTEMAELGKKYSGVDLIEMGTSRNLARVYRDIISFCSGELREMVAAYLMRWDVNNIKTILRGKFSGATVEEIQEEIVPAGSLSEERLSYLISLDRVQDVIDAVKKKDVKIPEEVLGAYERQGNLAPIEDWLEKWYYTKLLETIKPTTRAAKEFIAYARREIDIANLRTLLKLKQAGLPADKIRTFMIEGGQELKMDELVRLSAVENFNQMVDELSKLKFYGEIKEPLENAKGTNSLTEVMLALQKYQAKRAEHFSHLYPLSVLPVIDFIIRKRIEVDNIRAIARGKQAGLDPEVIKRLLVI